MIHLKEFIEAINYKITGGCEYGWDCFGPNARYLDSDDTDDSNSTYHIGAVFDSVTQTVYQIEAWDYLTNREYRWTNPEYRFGYEDEAANREVLADESMEGRTYIDLDVIDDIMEKISKIVAGEHYDTRVKVPVDFTDEELLKYMKLAHELDITFNELVERAIKAAIEDFERDPDSFKHKAKRFINENYPSV